MRADPGGRRSGGADHGRGRSGGSVVGLPGRLAPALHRPGHPAHGGRGPDRPRANRPLVRLPAPRHRAGRGDHGQVAGQRDAGRCVLGPWRGGRRLRTGGPRQHLRRAAAGHGRGPGHPRGARSRGCSAPGPGGRCPADRGPRADPGCHRRPRAGALAGGCPRPRRGAVGRPGHARRRFDHQRPAAGRAALRAAVARHRGGDRPGRHHPGPGHGRPPGPADTEARR